MPGITRDLVKLISIAIGMGLVLLLFIKKPEKTPGIAYSKCKATIEENYERNMGAYTRRCTSMGSE